MISRHSLYDAAYEHDGCGVGFVTNIDGSKSHTIIERGIEVLKNLLHRGASGSDVETGDGAGILIQLPDTFFQRETKNLGFTLPAEGYYGVGMIFLPLDEEVQKECRQIIEQETGSEGLSFIGWREVPVTSEALGKVARSAQPLIMQCFISGDGEISGIALERKLYVLRKQIEHRVQRALSLGDNFYIPSLSCRTIVYKGMMMGLQVPAFYQDLTDPEVVSAMAVVHQRYSTNTFPSWKLAQPFRYLAHNGEINTLRGNKNQMTARENRLKSEFFGDDLKKLVPILDETASDSACLDNMLELLALGGRTLPHSMMMLIPQAWGVKYPIGPDLRGFFEYHAGMMEPWDGPAAVAFCDGTVVGALLDRNGLRPCRYTITKDGFMVLASETGVLHIPDASVLEKGALRPGEIIMVDIEKQRILYDKEIKMQYARRRPYRRWVNENRIDLRGLFGDVVPVPPPEREKLLSEQRRFGYSREDINLLLYSMALKGNEPVGAMGCDTPLAVFSEKPQLLFNYFKQLFAQITNPAIDPIREELVLSLMTFIGNTGNILSEIPQNARLIKLIHPILTNDDLGRIRSLNLDAFKTVTLKIGFPGKGRGDDLKRALIQLYTQAELAVRNNQSLIILSDRSLDETMVPIPSLLAVSVVNRHLICRGLRSSAGIIIETGEAREVEHMALLLGYGATAVNPYCAFATIADLVARNALGAEISPAKAIENYIKAVCKGLCKIMTKMGISTLRSYRGAQVFEAVGLKKEFVDRYFTGTASRIEGIGLDEIAREAYIRYTHAMCDDPLPSSILPAGGHYRFHKDGERHFWSPEAIVTLQQATQRNDRALFRKYTKMIDNQSEKLFTLRGMFTFKKTKPIPLNEVEPAEKIMKRFATSAMSFGSISREAHETLAIAMNRIGAMSNSGEGGEDPERYKPLPNGDSRCSTVKQVASGRFGVNAEYLINAREIQIKIAQGAKPGEGGQLPGHKVNVEIARVRHSTPGVSLISPPPHHDIYSIEDIKQLIFDLKNVNPQARVSVKLVSEVGVGTIAAGVAKAHADMVLISGFDGGTGASPLSSIKYAGAPWELGLSDTQQTLMQNHLRSRIRIQTDGQMKTGRDVIIAALLGAEEYGFGTLALILCGCVMMRKCNENICSVGVATQDPDLRKRFKGKPEYVVNFFRMLTEQIREYMAQLGFPTMDEMIGRTDLLEFNKAIDFWKARGLDFSRIFFRHEPSAKCPSRCTESQDHGLKDVMDHGLIEEARPALEEKRPVAINREIKNVNLATCAMLSGEIAKRYGSPGLPDDTITCTFKGSAGQSFGAFGARGITMILEGDANDYLGKGLSGAKIIVKPPADADFDPSKNIICGNVLLYGATEGEVYINGCVGERFAIRNSGTKAVVEGVGDHGCEYMTGGRIVILGDTGVNFAAGMSGGIAYVFDPLTLLDARCNLDMVDLELVIDDNDVQELHDMILSHFTYTKSKKARYILDNWEECLPSFVKVFPMEYRRVLGQMMKEDEATMREEVELR